MRTARFIARRGFTGRRVPSMYARDFRKMESTTLRWNSRTVVHAISSVMDTLSESPDRPVPSSTALAFEEDEDGT